MMVTTTPNPSSAPIGSWNNADATLQQRLENTYPEMAASAWGLTTLPFDASELSSTRTPNRGASRRTGYWQWTHFRPA
jgi:hypothetical protein